MNPLTPIKSSVLTGHAYDPNARQLTVEFHNGSRHVFRDVPIDKYEAFTGSASPGAFFNAKIKPNHVGRKIS